MKPGMLLAAVFAAVISLPASAAATGRVSITDTPAAPSNTRLVYPSTLDTPLIIQPPNQSDGFVSDIDCSFCGNTDITQAENFILTGTKIISQVTFWGGYYPNNIPLAVDTFDILIHEDAFGVPGAVVYSATGLAASQRFDTGIDLFGVGVDEYQYEVDLPFPPALTPGAYWIEIFNDTGSATPDDWFWEVGFMDVSNGVPGHAYADEAPGAFWNPDPNADMTADLALVLIEILPELTIDDVIMPEGNTGTTDMIFTITRDRNDVDMSVDWAATDGVAKNGIGATPFDDDYNTPSGTVFFVAGGAFSQIISIPVTGDTRYEMDEDFSVLLSNPVHAIIADGQGFGTILNDDTAITCDLPSNPLLNCSFETGDFSDWLEKDIADVIPMSVEILGSPSLFGLTHPTDGIFSVTNGFDGAGPDTYELAQDVSMPPGATMLEFDYRLGWGNSGADRTLSVNIEPAGGGVPLQSTPVQSTAGIPFMPDTGILRGEVDVSAFAGQPVRVNFVWTIPETFTGPGSAELDNVLIRVPPAVRVSPTSGLTTTEGGGSTSFDVVLDTAPSGVVTLDFVSSDPGEGTVSTTTVDFTAANWNVPQTINVTGVNDDVMDGDQPYMITGSIAFGSPEYPTSMPVDDVSVVNLDNNAQLTIRKVATGGDTTFKFSSTTTPMLDSASITTSGGSGQQEFFTGLLEGTHNLTEDAKTGWVQGLASCDKGKTLPDIQLDAGDNVTCTFENTEMGRIKVFKETVGGFGTFEFASKALGPFEIAIKTETGNKGAATFNRLLPGTYDIAEIVPDGWSLSNQFCDDGSILPDIDVSPGESVTCTFINTLNEPRLTLTKSAAPASFALLGDNIRYLFEAKNEGNVELTGVTVTDPLSGLGTIDCDGSGGPTVATLAVAGSVSCEAMYAITQADLDKGSVTNKAAVVAKDPSLKDVTTDSNEVTISKLADVCFDGELTIPDGMIFAGDGTTMYASTVSIDTWAPAANGVIVEAPHELILNAPEVRINELFSVEADADLEQPPGGGQLRVIIGPVNCNAPPGVVE